MYPTWKNTLYPHRDFGHIDRFLPHVRRAGYPFYEWNGRIYAASGEALRVPICLASDLDAQLRLPERG